MGIDPNDDPRTDIRAIEWVPIPRDSIVSPNQSGIEAGAQRQLSSSFSTRQYESDLNRAFELSMQEQAGVDPFTLEPENPHERAREGDTPVGLKNVGNSCYFTSIAQNYFLLKAFREIILTQSFPEDLPSNDPRNVVKELQVLFAYMILSRRKYIDPTSFLNTLVDKDGQCIHKGHQEDPLEFRLLFLEKIQESITAILNPPPVEDVLLETVLELSEPDKESSTEEELMFEIDLTSGLNSPFPVTHNNTFKPQEDENITIEVTGEKIEVKEEGEGTKVINNLFSGIFMQTIHGEEADGTTVESNSESSFTEVILDLSGARDIYDSLDNYTELTEFSDFVTPKGHKCEAQKIVSLKSIPPVLSFQIQRVDYDMERNIAVKNHSRLDFPKVLYLDRYKTENIKSTMKLRAELETLNMRKSHFEALLRNLSSFSDSSCSVKTLLETSISFLETQDDPIKNETLATLHESLENVLNRERDYTAKIRDIDMKIDAIYNDMNSVGYRLHSTLVHSGCQAGGGHYWAYSFDYDNQKWYKYNDTHVSEVDEETVFNESRGGLGNESAYCLTYVHPDYRTGPPNILETSRLISPELQISIATDNEDLEDEIERWDRGDRKSSPVDNITSLEYQNYPPPSFEKNNPQWDVGIQNSRSYSPVAAAASVVDDVGISIDENYKNMDKRPVIGQGMYSLGSHFSKEQCTAFRLRFDAELRQIHDSSLVICDYDLTSYAHFLQSNDEIDQLRVEVAQRVLLDLFSYSKADPLVHDIPLVAEILELDDPQTHHHYHRNYLNATAAWEAFLNGLNEICKHNRFYQAANFFYYAYQEAKKVNLGNSTMRDLFLEFCVDCIQILSDTAHENWRTNQSVRLDFLLACEIAALLDNNCSTFVRLKSLWSPVIKIGIHSDSNEDKLFFKELNEIFSEPDRRYNIEEPVVTATISEVSWQAMPKLLNSISAQLKNLQIK